MDEEPLPVWARDQAPSEPLPADLRPMSTAPLHEEIQIWHIGDRYNAGGDVTGEAEGWIDATGIPFTGDRTIHWVAPACDDVITDAGDDGDPEVRGWRPKP